MRILGIDPGGTTGFAVVEDGKYERSWGWSLPKLYNACAQPWMFADFAIDTFVIEDFVLYSWKHKEMGFDKLPAPRAIGALMVAMSYLGVEPIWQLAGVVKPVLPNPVLVKHIVIPEGLSAHEKDAIRHALYYHFKETHGKKR